MADPVCTEKVPAYFPALRGLRLLLIFTIIYYHGYLLFGPLEPSRLDLFIRHYGGTIGNQAFFTLSGFLLSHGYAKKIQCGALSFQRFFKSRLLALYPLYFITACFGIVLNFFWNRFADVNFQNVFLDLTMLSSGWFGTLTRFNSPLWFCCVIMQCYLLFYLIHFLGRKNPNFPIYSSFFLVLLGWAMLTGVWQFPYLNQFTGQGLFGFFIGQFLYEFYLHTTARVRLITAYSGLTVIAVIGVLSVFCGFKTVIGPVPDLFFSVLFSPVVILLCVDCKLVVKILCLKPVAVLGSMSLSFYMWHDPLIRLFYFTFYQKGLFFNGAPAGIRAVVYLCVLLTVSVISYKLIEGKLRSALRRRFLGGS